MKTLFSLAVDSSLQTSLPLSATVRLKLIPDKPVHKWETLKASILEIAIYALANTGFGLNRKRTKLKINSSERFYLKA